MEFVLNDIWFYGACSKDTFSCCVCYDCTFLLLEQMWSKQMLLKQMLLKQMLLKQMWLEQMWLEQMWLEQIF